MGLFKGKNKKTTLDSMPSVLQDDLKEKVNYDDVLEFMVGLSDEDYSKLCSVSKIYRDANTEAAKVMGAENKPTTSIQLDEEVSDEQIDRAMDEVITYGGDVYPIHASKPKTIVPVEGS